MQIEFNVYFFNLYCDYQRMFRKQIAVSVITVFGLSACNVDHTIRQVKDDADDGLAFFSSTAGNNITVTKKTEDGRMVTDILVEEGHAVAYFGGSKEEIQDKHMANRKKLIREGLIDVSLEEAGIQ